MMASSSSSRRRLVCTLCLCVAARCVAQSRALTSVSHVVGGTAKQPKPNLVHLQQQHLQKRPRLTPVAAALRGGGIGFPGASSGNSKPRKDQMTTAITVTTVAGGAAQVKWPQWTEWGAKHGPSILSGQWWRLLTPALLHGSVVHLACNMFSLHSVGTSLEAWYGPQRFLAVYTAGAVAGNLMSTWAKVGGLSVGASGAIAGVVGALSVHHFRHRDLFANSDSALRSIGQVVALNAFLGLSMGGIDNWAHLGGLLGGAAAGYLIGARYVPVRDRFGRIRGYRDQPLLRF